MQNMLKKNMINNSENMLIPRKKSMRFKRKNSQHVGKNSLRNS